MAEPGYAFTLAIAADSGRIAAKRIVGKDDGSRETFGYDRITRWHFQPKRIAGHAAMAALLKDLAGRPGIALVMGAVRPGIDPARPHLRRWADPDPVRNTLVAAERAWLAIDVDDYGVPAPWGLAAHLADAATCIRDDALGEEFAGVTCVAAATGSSGLAGEDTARLRLFFLLDRAWPLGDLRRWALGAQAAGLPIDPVVFQAGQPIYTARPLFRGMCDPVPEALRAFLLPGRGDRVALDVHRFDGRAAEIATRVRHAEAWCGGDWRQLLTATLGGPASFFVPLSRALGLAARSPDSEEEVTRFVAALLAERGDPGRCRQYGPRWVATTLQRFRRFDRLVCAQAAELRASMFTEGAGR